MLRWEAKNSVEWFIAIIIFVYFFTMFFLSSCYMPWTVAGPGETKQAHFQNLNSPEGAYTGWMDGWMMAERMDGWMGGWIDGWMDGQMDEHMDG